MKRLFALYIRLTLLITLVINSVMHASAWMKTFTRNTIVNSFAKGAAQIILDYKLNAPYVRPTYLITLAIQLVMYSSAVAIG